MPIFDDAPAAGLPLLSPRPLDITPPVPPFSKLFDAGMRRENTIGSLTEAATQPPMGAFDPSFDPFSKIEGYEDYARSFIGANNDDDVLHIKTRIDKEKRDAELLNSGGWRGKIALLGAGVLDPINMLPAGGQIRAITRGGRALEGMIRGGAALGAGDVLQELGLQGTQITRPTSESLMNIGSATVFGGVLGGAVGHLTRGGVAHVGGIEDIPWLDTKLRRLASFGDSAAVGGAVFDRELAANLPGARRPVEPMAEIIDAARVEREFNAVLQGVAPEQRAAATAKVAEGLAARVKTELDNGSIVEHVNQGGQRTAITGIDENGILTDANGVKLRLNEVTSPGNSLEIREPRIDTLTEAPPVTGEGGSVGAMFNKQTKDQLTLANSLGIDKAIVEMSPTLRTVTSPSVETRRIALELADQPADLKGNVEGIATPQSVESLIKQFQAPLAEAEVGVDDAFVRYRLGRARRVFDITKLEARDMFGAPQGAMSYGEFREAISAAMRRGDQSVTPEVAEAAKLLREKVFDPLKERAIAAGLLPEDIDPKTALSYLMRVYDTNKIKAQRTQFEDRITRWLGDEQVKKDTIRTRVTALLEEHETLAANLEKRMRQMAPDAREALRTGYQARSAAIQTELENLVKSWEGATTREAKAALERRAEAEAIRYGMSLSPDQARLRAADKPVIKAARAIAEANTRLERGELSDITRQIVDRILGSPVGRLPYDMEVPHPRGGPPRPDRADPRGPLAGRVFMIPDEIIEPWLENDSRHIARAYTRTMAPDVLLAERFGRTDMEAQFQKIQEHYAELRQGASEAQLKKLAKAMSDDLRDIGAMRDRLRGTYGLPVDPNGVGNRVYHVVRDLNYLRLLGGMTLSAFPDMGRIVMVHGLSRTFGDAIVPMLKDFHQFAIAAREAKLSGTALDMVLDTRAMSIADMLDDYGRWSKYERGVKAMTDKFGLVTLMAPWNAAVKQIAGVIGQTRTLQVIEDLMAGKTVRQAERTRLASLGIGEDMARRIDAEFKAHGVKQDNGSWWANSSAWTDRGATEAFRSALNKEIDTTIVTKGQEIPLWMSRGVGRMIGQFRTFNVASTQRVLMTGLQKRDMATLSGVLLMTGLGMMVYGIRTITNPRAQPLPDPTTGAGLARWIREGVDISGLTGYFFDVHNMIEKATGGGVGLSRLTGGPLQSRYANRNVLESILGPTAGLISDTGQLIGAATKGEWTAGESSRLRRMIPTQNLIGMRHLFDAAESGLNQSLGIRERRP